MAAAAKTTNRLSAGLLRDIQQKRLLPGAKIPSFRTLARRFGVSMPTVQRAIMLLEEQGYVRSVHGSGTFVTDRVPVSSDPGARSSVVIAAFPFRQLGPETLLNIQRQALSKGMLFTQWFAERFAQDLTFEKELINHARKERLRAILLFTSPKPPTNDALFQEVKREGLRIIHLAQYKKDMEGEEYVTQDFYRGGVAAATYLLRRGYSRFFTFIIGGDPDYFGCRIKDGIFETLRDQGIPASDVQHIQRTSGFKLPTLQRGDALISDSPYVVSQLLPRIQQQNLRVPQDVGVISCAENVEATEVFPFPRLRFSASANFIEALNYLSDDGPSAPCRLRIGPKDLLEPSQ